MLKKRDCSGYTNLKKYHVIGRKQNMSKRLYADFSDKAFEDLMNGVAVDNNGFRLNNGRFHPDQPTFHIVNERQEFMKDAGIKLLVAAGSYVALDIILPELKRFADEKVYPFLSAKWDEKMKKQSGKSSGVHEKRVDVKKAKIINVCDYSRAI